jgi:hypothetical protein
MSTSFSTVKFFVPFYPKTAKHKFIAMMRAYFDDSGTHTDGRSQMVTCGGVIIEDEQHDQFTEEWNGILARTETPTRKAPPFFHFTKLKAHRVPPYCDMTKGERDILLYQLLLAIRVRVRFCFCGVMPVSVYEETLTPAEKERYGPAFAWAVQLTWRLIRSWEERNKYYDPIPFVVEASNKDADAQLIDVFNQTKSDPILEERYRLHSLVVGSKTGFTPLQAADIVANSFFEVNSRVDRRYSSEVVMVDEMLSKFLPVRSVVFDSQWLRSEVDTLNELHKDTIKKREADET